jgi:hypothetical protein
MIVNVRTVQSVTSEMNMYKTQLNDFKFDISRLRYDLENTKDKYFEIKRKEQNRTMLVLLWYISKTFENSMQRHGYTAT